MTLRPADFGETALSLAEAAYLHHDHDLWTAPKHTDMPVSAANGSHESEQSNQEARARGNK